MAKLKLVFNPPASINDIFLGTPKKEIHKLLGKCDGKDFADNEIYGYRDREYYFNHELCIFYDRKQSVDFIEVYGYGSTFKETELYGLNVFETRGDDLLAHIRDVTGDFIWKEYSDPPYSYCFKELQMTFWKNSGPTESDDDEEMDEFGNGHFFLSVGIGTLNALTNR